MVDKFKNSIIIFAILIASTSLMSCDHESDPERIINIGCDRHYLNTTESWYVNSNNGYRAYDVSEEYNEEVDEYTVILKFKKVE